MKYKIFILFNLIGFSLLAQSGKIKGLVKTSDNNPAEFINVGIKSTNKGAVTNNKGEFEITNIQPGIYTLVISFVGLETKEQPVEVLSGETTLVPEIILNENAQQLSEVVITEYESNPYERTKSEYVAKLPLKGIENPQVYNVITAELLSSQVVTNFDDALKNAPGVEKLWESTGRGGDGAGYYSLRGFAVQPTMVNGLPGLTNGSLDPANIDAIEVIKGPSGTLFGSSLISYGGLINVVTKKPYHDRFGGEVAYTLGSFGLNRVTADVNVPLQSNDDIAFRLVSAYHHENSFQDAGFRRSVFVAPSLSYKVNDRLSFLINTEFYNSEGTNPTMLFLYRSDQLEYENLEDLNYDNNLSLTSNDLTIKNPRFSFQGQMQYKLSDKWTSQTAISRSIAKSEGYYSYLWDSWKPNNLFNLYISDQNADTHSTDIQQNFIGDFNIGKFRNRMVVGLDYFHRNVVNNSTGYALFHNVTAQGEVRHAVFEDSVIASNLSSAAVDALLATAGINNSNSKEQILSAYVSDVINLTRKLSIMASLRIDYFDNQGEISDNEDDFEQTSLSPKFGIVYQPLYDKLSIFGNYMNGFMNVGPAEVSDLNEAGEPINSRMKSFEPEHANQMEFGVKTSLFNKKLISTLSYYDIKVSNRVFVDPTNVRNSIQGGEVESQGIEIDLNASPISGLNFLVGYSYNKTEVTEGLEISSWEEKGKRPAESGPEEMFNVWATYRFTQGTLRGVGIGFGANAASERVVLDSKATGRFALPSYKVFNASVFYNVEDFRITFNVDNLADEEYYKGWSTINPQRPRRVSASFAYKF